jgi:hypothetical protein
MHPAITAEAARQHVAALLAEAAEQCLVKEARKGRRGVPRSRRLHLRLRWLRPALARGTSP